ncbi:MAG: D-alanyl-D-alanine carboxypeptidase/D-alanyl-D-alanine endopeptidase [Bacteroidia bacterium]
MIPNSPYILRLKNAFIAVLGLLSIACFISFSPPADSVKLEKLRQVFKAFVNDPALAHASVGFSLVDTETGKTIYEHNSNQSLIPASSQKIVTTGAALGILGEEFTFKTQLAYDSISGNIYIIGGGDPTLGSDRVKGSLSYEDLMNSWAEIIQSKLKGRPINAIIADPTHYENATQPANWAWNDIGNYYGAGASGLSINENTYTVTLNASAKVGGDVEIVEINPKIKNLQLKSELKTGTANSGDNAYIFGAPYNYNHIIRGTIPAASKNFKIKGSMPDPAMFCAENLANALTKKGIVHLGAVNVSSLPVAVNKLTVLHTHISPPLKDIVYHTNLKSVNLYAEHLLKECGYKVFKNGSTEAGVKAITQFWQNKGVNADGFFMHDGSGLSHYNAITTKQLAQILAAIKKETYFNSFYNSLPIAGENGAMRNMGDGTTISGKLRAKSGHMDRIRSYAGYTSTDKKYAFALIVNNYTCSSAEIKSKIEKVLVALSF